MVAVVSGNGLGLFNTSLNVLGGSGVLGQGMLGQFGGRAYVNAVNGNLVMQVQDEQVSGRGLDLLQLRTYNSQGLLNDGDADNWRWSGERTLVLSGTRNTSGSTVARTNGDGSVTTYSWDGARYSSHDGDGADDSLVFDNGAAQQWVFTDGSSQLEERYSGAATGASPARLASQRDSSGNIITYGYDGNRLQFVTDSGSGQQLKLTYAAVAAGSNLVRLSKVETFELTVDGNGRATGTLGAAIKQVDYGYDATGRLTSVTTDLTPDNTTDSGTPNTLYKTKYTYEGTSNRIASVAQSDGAAAGFVYASFTYDNTGRVKTVTDANGTQTYTYGATSTDIKLSDDAAGTVNARTWTYTYDANQRLIKVESPAPTAGAARLVTQYHYDDSVSGNVDRITDALNNIVSYVYDAQGNCTLERDAEGNTISRTYDAKNQLLTETHYKTPDPDGAGSAVATDPLTTRYVYDSQSRLRFIISAEGRVSESRYGTSTDGYGLLTRTLRYTANRYDTSALSATQAPSEADMTAWLASGSVDKSQVEQTRYEYDLRGNLSRRTDYASTDSSGNGLVTGATGVGATVTDYIYDGHGELRQTIAVRGTNRDASASTQLTSLAYDGLGRLSSATSSGSNTQTTVYDDVNHKITVTASATGLVTTSNYDTVGHLVSVSQAAGGVTRPASVYKYDAQGRLQMVQDGLGARRFSFYDDAGRLLYQVDSTGAVTGYEYKSTGQASKETRYGYRPDISAWVDGSGNVTKTALTLSASGDVRPDANLDRVTSYLYDKAGRLTTRTDAANVQTQTFYDGLSRVTKQVTGNQVTQYFYDGDGRQVGVVDPLGYLTESKYDAAGRLTETVRYSTRSPGAVDAGAPVWVGVTNQTAVGGKPFEYHLPAAYDPDGDALSFSVVGTPPGWLSFDATSLTLKGTPPAGLTGYDITLQASDGRGRSTNVSVHITVANSVPVWANLPDAMVVVNTSVSLPLPAASDNETAAGSLIYAIVGSLPPGITFNAATRTLSGTPTTAGLYAVTVRVADGTGAAALFTDKTFMLQVAKNDAPVWPSQPAIPTTFVNQSYSVTLFPAVDPEGQVLTYSVISKPTWLSFDAGTLRLSGTPNVIGVQGVVLEARDAAGATSQLSFNITVQNRAPTWGQPANPSAQLAGLPIDYTPLAAQDPDAGADSLSYSATGLPAGLSINAANGRITGTARTASGAVLSGSVTVTLRATDASGAFVERNVVIQLNNVAPRYLGGINDFGPVVIDTDVEATVGMSINVGSAFIDDNTDVLTYSVSGATHDRAHDSPGMLAVFFTVGAHTSGDAQRSITITATDPSGLSVSRTFIYSYHATWVGPKGPMAQASDESAAVVATAAGAAAAGAVAAVASVDVLASWRPSASGDDRHSYQYYDGQGRLVGAVDERGYLSEIGYDMENRVDTTTRYLNFVTVGASDTLATLKTRANTGATSLDSSSTTYDTFGRVSTSTAVDGTVTSSEYDSVGRLVRQVRGVGLSDQRASDIRYNAFGEVTGTLGGVGDAALRVAHPTPTQADIDAALISNGTRYEYDALGRRTKAITRDVNGNDQITLYYYDSESRLTHSVDSMGEVTETVYNAFGQVQSTIQYGTRLLSDDDIAALKAGTQGLADLKSELLQLPANRNRVTSYEYDLRGQVKTTTDAEGFVTTNTYTDFGQLATQTRTIAKAVGGVAAQTTATQYGYDLRGELLAQTGDAGGLNFNQRIEYDAFGRVTKSVDAAGKATTTAYSDSGRTLIVTDPLNRAMRSEYDAFGRVLKQFDASGTQTTYAYDDVARSIRMTVPVTATDSISVLTLKTRFGETLSVTRGLNATETAGQTTSYGYNQDGQLTNVTDALGHVVSHNDYDNTGLLSQSTDANGVVTTFKYTPANRMFERIVDPITGANPNGLNQKCSYQFDALGQQTRVTESEGAGNRQIRATVYKYDLNGRLTSTKLEIIDANGDAASSPLTSYSYDGLGETIQVSQGTVGTPNQVATQYVFDKLGRRVKEIAAPSAVFGAGSASARDLTTEYRYDAAGRVSRRIDAAGQSTWYVYDAAGQLNDTINAEGEVSQSSYDLNGRVVQTRNYATRLSAATLAGFGDVVGSVAPAVSDDDQRSYAVYDLAGRQRYSLQAVQATNSNWSISENIYDKSGNVIETRRYDLPLTQARIDAIDSAGSAGITVDEVKTELATLGYNDSQPATLAAVQRSRFAYDADNRLRFTVDASGSVSESVYDNAGQVTKSVRYAVRPTLGAYDLATIDGAVDRLNVDNQVSYLAYDKGGRLRYSVRVLASNGAGQATQLLVSEQVHDALGQLTQSTAYATVVQGSFADADISVANLATQVTANAAADRRSVFVYDNAGRQVYSLLVSRVDAQGQTQYLVSRQVYDGVGHVMQSTHYASEIKLSDFGQATVDAALVATPQDRTTRYAYDKAGRQRFLVAADGSVSETVYNALGQVSEARRFDLLVTPATVITEDGLSAYRGSRKAGDGVTRVTQYAYDRVGRQRFVVDADGSFGETVYNALGQVSETREFDLSVTATTPITSDGLSTLRGSRVVGDGVTRGVSYLYDRSGHLLTSTDAGSVDPTSGALVRHAETYTYDALGNRKTFTDKNGATWDYDYDLLGRLKTQTAPAVLVKLGSASPASVRLVTGIAYDALGNLTQRTEAQGTVDARTTAYGYDRLGRQTKVTQPGWYDPGTKRVESAQGDAALGRFQRTVETAYDALGNDVRHSVRTGAGSGDVLYEYKTYDALGRVVHDVDVQNHVTAFSYTVFGEQRTVTRYSVAVSAPASDSGNLWTASTLGSAVAALRSDPDARTIVTSYDSMGRKTQVTQLTVSLGHVEDNWASGLTLFEGRLNTVAAETNADGRIELFGTNSIGQVWHRSQLTPGGAWSGWAIFDGTRRTVALARNQDGRLELFSTDADDHIWHASQTTPGGDWSGWQQFDGQLHSVAAETNADGRIELFGANSAGQVWHRWQLTPGGAWSDWHGLDGSLSTVAVARNQDGRLELFGTNSAGAIVHRSQLSAGSEDWSNWSVFDGSLATVAAETNADGRIELFGTNSFGQSFHTVQLASGGWSAWALLDSAGMNQVAVAREQDGRLAYFATTTVDEIVHRQQDETAPTTSYAYNAFGEISHEAVKVSVGVANDVDQWRDTWHYFDTLGRETRTVDALGYQTERSYDALGNLKDVKEYATAGLAGRVGAPPPAPPATSGNDRVTHFNYNALNQQTSIQRMGLHYSSWNGTAYVDVNNASGTATTVSSTTYDGVGHVLTQTDGLGNVTRTAYNALGQVIQRTEPARLSAGSGVDPFLNQVTASPVTAYTLNAFGQVVQQARSAGGGTGDSLVIQQEYDAGGNLVKITDANYNAGINTDNSDANVGVKFRQYDYAGRLIKETQSIKVILDAAVGQSEIHTLERRYAYDASGHQTYVVDVFMDGSQLMQSGQRNEYNAFGEVVNEYKVWGLASASLASLTHPKAATSTYNDAGQLISRETSEGKTNFFYNAAGLLVRQEQTSVPRPTPSTAPPPVAPRVTETFYDVLGRAIRQRLPGFQALVGTTLTDIRPVTEQTYDRWGNVATQSRGGYQVSTSSNIFNEARALTTYEYNADNQVIAEHLPVMQALRTDGVGYLANVTHALSYDLLGRAVQDISQVADDTSTTDRNEASTRMRLKVYDAAGQLTQERDGTNVTTTYAYDANGNKVGTSKGSGATRVVYVDAFDRNGNVVSHGVLRQPNLVDPYTGAAGQTPTLVLLNLYKYDQANRRVGSADVNVVLQTGGGGATLWTYTQYDERNLIRRTRFQSDAMNVAPTINYDVLGNRSSQFDGNNTAQSWLYDTTGDYTVGRLISSTAGTRTTTYGYDGFGQVNLETYTDSSGALTAGQPNNRVYTYNAGGLITQLKDTSAFGILGPNQSSTVPDYWKSTDTTTYTYTVRGERASEAFKHEYEHDDWLNYDNEGKPSGVTVTPTHDPDINRLTNYTYDVQGRVSSISTPVASNAGRNTATVSYAYDARGNRLQVHGTYLQAGSTTFHDIDKWNTYDAEGRMLIVDGRLADAGTTSAQIKADVAGATTVSYDYANQGRRSTAEMFSFTTSPAIVNNALQTSTTYSVYRQEKYSYNDLGYLKVVQQRINWRDRAVEHLDTGTIDHPADTLGTLTAADAAHSETRSYNVRGDELSRTKFSEISSIGFNNTTTTAKLSTINSIYAPQQGRLASQATIVEGNAAQSSSLVNNYDAAGVLRSYVFNQGTGDAAQFQNTYTYTYTTQFGGYKQTRVDVQSSQAAQNGGFTTNDYDSRGELMRQTIFSPGQQTETLSFSYNSDGQIVTKNALLNKGSTTTFGTQDYIYSQGHQAGVVGMGTLTTAQFNNDYTPISAAYPGTTPGSYVVNAGDTLGSIAQAVFGDAQLWYLIADANSVSFAAGDTLPISEVGRTYRIPNVVGNVHNNASTFAPYNPSDIIGAGMPTWSYVPPHECSRTEQILSQVLITAVSVAAQIVVTYAATQFGAGAVAPFLGAAAGNLAGQTTAWSLGVQDGVDFNAAFEAGAQAELFSAIPSAGADAGLGKRALYDGTSAIAQELFAEASRNDFSASGLGGAAFSGVLSSYTPKGMASPWATNLLSQVANDVFNPQSGWLFNDKSRDWAHIASQAAGALTGVVLGRALAGWGGEEQGMLAGPDQDSNVRMYRYAVLGARWAGKVPSEDRWPVFGDDPRADDALARAIQYEGDVQYSADHPNGIVNAAPNDEPIDTIELQRQVDQGDYVLLPDGRVVINTTLQIDGGRSESDGSATLIGHQEDKLMLSELNNFEGNIPSVTDRYAMWERRAMKAARSNDGVFSYADLPTYFKPEEFESVLAQIRQNEKLPSLSAPGHLDLITPNSRMQIEALQYYRHVQKTGQRFAALGSQGGVALLSHKAAGDIAELFTDDQEKVNQAIDMAVNIMGLFDVAAGAQFGSPGPKNGENDGLLRYMKRGASQKNPNYLGEAAGEMDLNTHPDAEAVISGAPSTPALMRELRRLGSPEALATAQLVKRGIKVNFNSTDPDGDVSAHGYMYPGAREIHVNLDRTGARLSDIAGAAAHEVLHTTQNIAPTGSTILQEIDAYKWARAVSPESIRFVNPTGTGIPSDNNISNYVYMNYQPMSDLKIPK